MGSVPDATDGQIRYIYRLLEMRVVTARTATRIIQLLEDLPPIGETGMDLEWLKKQYDDLSTECPPDDFWES